MSEKIPDPHDSWDVEALPQSDEVIRYEACVERAAKALLVLYFGRRGQGYGELLTTIAHEYDVDIDDVLDAKVMGIAAKSVGYFGGTE